MFVISRTRLCACMLTLAEAHRLDRIKFENIYRPSLLVGYNHRQIFDYVSSGTIEHPNVYN